MEKLNNIPSLRFPEFNGEWENKKLGEVAEKRIVKNKDNKIKNVFTNSAIQGIVNQRDFFDKDIANQNNLLGYYIVEHNDFVYNPRISNYAPVGPISRNNLQSGIMSPLYSVFRFNFGNVDFVEYFFNTTKWHKHMEDIANYGARDDRMSFSTGDFYKMPILFPNIKEQNKIASFLTVVNEKLQTLKTKKSLLEQYKKGVMKRIFSQELRFKDDNENDYPDWDEKKLGDLCNYKNGGSFEKFVSIEGIYNLISLNSIDINGKLKKQHKKVTITDNSLQKGDLIMVLSDVAHGNFLGLTDIIPNNEFVLNQRMAALKPKTDFNSFYLKTFINYNQSYFKLMGQGSSQLNLSKGDVENFIVKLPIFEEQTKIANFLSTIDEKIEHCQKQIENTEVWKKGLLQKMFV